MTRRAGAALAGLIAVLLTAVPGAAPAWAGSLARTMPAQPGAPTGLSATAVSSSEIDLSWTAPSGDTPAAGYDIRYGTVSGAEDTSANSDVTTYQATGLNSCQTYYFVVDAVDARGNVSTDSAPVQARTFCPTPVTSGVTQGGGSSQPLAAPTGLTATAVSSSEIDLSWTSPGGDPSPAGYAVYDGTTQGQEGNNPVNAQLATGTTYQVKNLGSGTTYYFVVDAVDANGRLSDDSNEAHAATLGTTGPSAGVVASTAPSGSSGSSGSSGGSSGAILPLIIVAIGAGGLIAWWWRRRRRRPAPAGTPAPQAAPASSVHAVARAAPPGVVVIRPTGTDATLTVRIESHKTPSITTIEEVPPR